MNTLGHRPRVAFQGEHGAFSEDAAIQLLGPEIELVPCPTFAALFSSIDEGFADYLLAPVENTLVGTIEPVATLLNESLLADIGEIAIQIQQQLIGCPGAVLEEIDAVESHPAALSQCRQFFAQHPLIKRIEAEDTAGSVARILRSGARRRAAIASRRAAKLYGGAILKEDLQDVREYYTKFVLLRLPHGRGESPS